MKANARTQKFTADVDAIRTKIADVKQRIKKTTNNPLPLDDAVKRLDAFIQYRGNEYGQSVMHHLFSAHSFALELVRWPRDEAGLMFVLGPAIRDRLVAQMREHAEAAGNLGLPASERPAALAALDRELLSLEIQEEELIEAAEAEGVTILRRTDSDARAGLGIREVPDDPEIEQPPSGVMDVSEAVRSQLRPGPLHAERR